MILDDINPSNINLIKNLGGLMVRWWLEGFISLFCVCVCVCMCREHPKLGPYVENLAKLAVTSYENTRYVRPHNSIPDPME